MTTSLPADPTPSAHTSSRTATEPPGIGFTVAPRPVLIMGIVVAVVLTVASTVGRVLAGDAHELSGWLFYFVPLTNVDAEGGLPAWFSTVLLMACAAALWTVAAEVRAHGGRWVGYWRALALGFVYLSVDESVRLHERVGQKAREVLGLEGALYFSWVVVAVPVVVVIVLVLVRFLRALPGSTRRAFVVSGAMYLGGAVGLEVVGAPLAEDDGWADPRYIAASTVEELLEMLGITSFLAAIAQYRLRVRHHATAAG